MSDEVEKKRYVAPRWVDEGMEVLIPWDKANNAPGFDRSGTACRCKVVVAAGHHARVVNAARGVDRWYHIDNLFIEEKAS